MNIVVVDGTGVELGYVSNIVLEEKSYMTQAEKRGALIFETKKEADETLIVLELIKKTTNDDRDFSFKIVK